MGRDKDAGCIDMKPKRKNRKKKKKIKKRPSRPKPSISLVSGVKGFESMRQTVEMWSFQVGETYEAGVARVAGAVGSTLSLQSILGKYEWVRKVDQS